MKRRVTLDDIAAATKASPATVSLALRNRAGVSPERRAEILDTARALGYVARPRPSVSDSAAVRNVGLLFRTPTGTAENGVSTMNHFYASVLAGLQDGARDRRMNLVLGMIPVDDARLPTVVPDLLLSQPLDGLLLVGALQPEIVDAVRERLATDRAALVLVDACSPGLEFDAVTSDHHHGMATATRHLIAHGHRRIGFAGPRPGLDANFDLRRIGYVAAMVEHGLTPRDIVMDENLEDAHAAMATHRGGITALACANDLIAHLIVHAARRIGVDVPGDLSLIGFDDSVEARRSHPTISTMAVDKAGMGRIAVTMLQARLERPDTAPMQMSMGVRLIERESVGPPTRSGASSETPIRADREGDLQWH